ncbi:MAG: RNA methyltransferase [Lachnospiraceae bacterium]|nr:RNA methyltransferase [Lachnospiraceae bacterium]MDD3796128.1 RNA methyltransferase [Lachnospiraceae bacterium]
MITSSANGQIKNMLLLKKKAKERNARDVFLVEGIKMFREVPKDRLQKVFVSAGFYEKPEHKALLQGLEFEVVSDAVFDSISDTRTPQGIICVVRQFHYRLEDLTKCASGQPPLCMILENLQDPGNLGTIFRTAEGAGVTGILLSRDCVDLYNPKVIRSTMGSVYRMPFYYAENFYQVIEQWKQQGIGLYAAHLKGKNTYDKEDYRKPSAFLIGNESQGLTDQAAGLSDHYIRIPMSGQVESLNAAIASAVLMYEARRQRG